MFNHLNKYTIFYLLFSLFYLQTLLTGLKGGVECYDEKKAGLLVGQMLWYVGSLMLLFLRFLFCGEC